MRPRRPHAGARTVTAMSNPPGRQAGSRRSEGRRDRPGIYAAGVVLLVALAVFVVVVFDPLRALASALPLPDLGGLPNLPDWLKWIWRGLMISLIALAVIGTIERGKR